MPREQSALSGEDTVTEECAESHRSENDKLGINLTNTPEDQRTQSSDEEKAALLAAAPGPCAPSESKFPAVSDMSCAVSHRCGRPDILTNSSESAGRSCGKDTLRAPPAQCDTFQPDVFSGVELVSPCPSKAHKRAERVAKRELSTKPLSKYCGVRQPAPTIALLHGHDKVFFCKQCGAVNAGGTLRLLKSLCDGTGESRQKAKRKLERGLMPIEQVTAEARILIAAHIFLDFARCFDSPCIVNLICHPKKRWRCRVVRQDASSTTPHEDRSPCFRRCGLQPRWAAVARGTLTDARESDFRGVWHPPSSSSLSPHLLLSPHTPPPPPPPPPPHHQHHHTTTTHRHAPPHAAHHPATHHQNHHSS